MYVIDRCDRQKKRNRHQKRLKRVVENVRKLLFFSFFCSGRSRKRPPVSGTQKRNLENILFFRCFFCEVFSTERDNLMNANCYFLREWSKINNLKDIWRCVLVIDATVVLWSYSKLLLWKSIKLSTIVSQAIDK